ncbi:hypothetical protein V5O48_000114 [Marasmius crinis-equi]|uniref:Inhibitor I9 domain-containing protein n=1 Tax=Marasmius crinis-equi TaxID=585013 RepID=A0ABR3G248_9AGAR
MSGKFIVVFKSDTSQEEVDKQASEISNNDAFIIHNAHDDLSGGEVHKKHSLLKGFTATIPESYMQQLQSLQGSVIDYIEPDGKVTTQ